MNDTMTQEAQALLGGIMWASELRAGHDPHPSVSKFSPKAKVSQPKQVAACLAEHGPQKTAGLVRLLGWPRRKLGYVLSAGMLYGHLSRVGRHGCYIYSVAASPKKRNGDTTREYMTDGRSR